MDKAFDWPISNLNAVKLIETSPTVAIQQYNLHVYEFKTSDDSARENFQSVSFKHVMIFYVQFSPRHFLVDQLNFNFGNCQLSRHAVIPLHILLVTQSYLP